MKTIEIKQNSPEWESLRRTKIGASDAPIIMGCSPYKTRLQLWKEKVMGQKSLSSRFTQMGHEREPEIRKWANDSWKSNFEPLVAQSEEYEWMIASLDGYYAGGILEIKCTTSADIAESCKNNKIPEHWKWQMQHQMYVTGVDSCLLLLHYENTGEKFAVTEYRNEEMIEDLLKKEKEFYQLMMTCEEPELEERDFVERPDMEAIIHRIKQLDKIEKDAKKEKEDLLKHAKEMANGESIRCNAGKLRKYFIRGQIDYKSIPILLDVNLEPFRKPGVEAWRLS